MDKWDKSFLCVIAVSVIMVMLGTGYKFLIAENYTFTLEAPCDPDTSTCYHRECATEDDCPPNQLENYTVFNIKAADFDRCSDNSCLKECENGLISCKEVICGSAEGDICLSI